MRFFQKLSKAAVLKNTNNKNNVSLKNEKNDHFVKYDGKLFAGHHYLVDVWGESKYLESEEGIKNLLNKMASAAGATVLSLHVRKFGEGQGITGIAILAESHVSIHTWPERSFTASRFIF